MRPISGSTLPARGLLVEVDGELLERAFLLAALLLASFPRCLRAARGFGRRLALADAVADVGHGIEAAHVLLLQEIDGVALALGEEGDEHVGAGHLVAAGRLDVQDRALDDALEAAGRSRVGGAVGDQSAPSSLSRYCFTRCAKLVAADAAGGHHLGRMLVVDQRDQKMFEGRILVPAAAGLRQRIVQGLFEFASETGHLGWYSLARRNRPRALRSNVIRCERGNQEPRAAYPQIIALQSCPAA